MGPLRDSRRLRSTGFAPAAYNSSIYLMVSVPYLSLAVVIFLIYRGLRKNAEHLRARGNFALPSEPRA